MPLKTPKSSQNRPKSSQNPAPDPSKTAPKRRLMLQHPKIKNNATLPRFCSFFTFPDPRKSSQNRCKNAFKISFMLDTLLEPSKIRFLMLKRRQDGPPNYQFFLFNRPKLIDLTVFGPRWLPEASKTLPRASKSHPRASQEAPKSPQEAPDT